MFINNDKEIEKYFNEYYAAICKYCVLRMPNHISYAEDIANEAFALLCKKWDSLEKNDIRAWLYRATDNLMKEFFRKQAKEAKKLEYIENMDDYADELIYELDFENISDDEIEIYKESILNGLSEKEKNLFEMNFVQRLPHKEIDRELLISEETLKKRLYRLKQKIILAVSEKLKER
jgi:RNA polymerase sigma-70 factor (ECF subfamily)